MGQRSRRDRPGHQQRAKGAPTPQAPKQGKQAPAREGTPPSAIVVWPHGVVARLSEHPSIDGPILDLYLSLAGGSLCTVRLPPGAWPRIADEVAKALAEIPEELERAAAQQRAHESGLVVASGGADIAREAAAHDQIKKGPVT